MARTINITDEQLRQVDRPTADYLYQTSRKEESARCFIDSVPSCLQ